MSTETKTEQIARLKDLNDRLLQEAFVARPKRQQPEPDTVLSRNQNYDHLMRRRQVQWTAKVRRGVRTFTRSSRFKWRALRLAERDARRYAKAHQGGSA